jgi:hypothetical protein
VDAAETAAQLTIKATSTVDATKSDTATVTVTELILNTIANIETYLAAASGGNSAADPILLEVDLDLTSDWADLLDAIAGKYVALDLSACAMSGTTTFDPGTNNNGEQYVTALILPDAATSIVVGSEGVATFRYFTALESVSGDNVTNIGQYAFYNCATLISADFPAAANIGKDAFTNCYLLTSVDLPAALTIQRNAFLYCYALTSVDLPVVTSIGDSAFINSTDLDTVTIGSGCYIIDANSFPNGFKASYDGNLQAAGTYIWNGFTWDFTVTPSN